MKTYFVKNYEELSKLAYEIVEDVISKHEYPVISLNTGGTPKGLFRNLVKGIQKGLNISKTTLFTLDEYVGESDAVFAVQRYMKERLLERISTKFYDVQLIHGNATNQDGEINRYKKLLANYTRDLQVLGLGTNGHIGANEPGTPFDSTMFVAKHTESTINSTMKEYDIERESVPKEMYTLGFTEILEAKKILLLVSGAHKAQAVRQLLEEDIQTNCPASCLRNHDNVIVIIDAEAASLLTFDYSQ